MKFIFISMDTYDPLQSGKALCLNDTIPAIRLNGYTYEGFEEETWKIMNILHSFMHLVILQTKG